MTKEKSKLVREVDEEGYFKFLLERDLKRRKLYGLSRFFSKILKCFTHLGWVHWYEETHEKVRFSPPENNGIEYAQIWRCSVCHAEATSKVIRWEAFKIFVEFLGISLSLFLVPYATLPIIGLLDPTLRLLLLDSIPGGGVISIVYRIMALRI